MGIQSKQTKFVWMVGKLIEFAYSEGYELTFGEAYRSPREAAADAAEGKGVAMSLHTLRLAIDFNLFEDGVYQQGTEAYEVLGIKWESMGGSWGGRFTKPDGNHFSLSNEGVR